MSSAQIDFLAGGLTDANGDPYDSVVVEFYEAGTSTPVVVYSDSALSSSLGSSTTLNSFGRLLAFFDATVSLKVVVKAVTGDEIFDGLQYAINLGANYIKPDGSVAMSGDLDLDGNDLDSAGDINMAAGSRVIFKVGGAWTPGASDMLVMGGSSGYWAMRGDLDMTIWDDGTKRLTLDSAGKLTLHTGGLSISGKLDGLTAGNATGEAVEYDQLQTELTTRDGNLSTHTADTAAHGATGAVVGTTNTQTLTNKTLTSPTVNGGTVSAATITGSTIDASANTVSELDTTHLASGVVDTDLSTVSASDDTLASAKAIKSYVDTEVSGGTSGVVSNVAYSSGWDNDTTTAPSKNAVYDKMESVVSDAATAAGTALTDNTFGCYLNWSDTGAGKATWQSAHIGTGIDVTDSFSTATFRYSLKGRVKLTNSTGLDFEGVIYKASGGDPKIVYSLREIYVGGTNTGSVKEIAQGTFTSSPSTVAMGVSVDTTAETNIFSAFNIERADLSDELCFRINWTGSTVTDAGATMLLVGPRTYAGTPITAGAGTKF